MKRKFTSIVVSIAILVAILPTLNSKAESKAVNQDPQISDNTITYSSVEDLPGGGKKYKFGNNANGGYTIVPPDGFNPITATDAQLAEYGFEPRPTDSKELADWTKVWSHYHGTAIPKFKQTNIKAGIDDVAPTGVIGNDRKYNNWSGYINLGDGTNGVLYNPKDIDAVEGTFVQPGGCTIGQEAFEFSWVGLGGDSKYLGKPTESGLIQTGTVVHEKSGNLEYFPCFEWISRNSPDNLNGTLTDPTGSIVAYQWTNSVIQAGDSIYCKVTYNPTTQQATFRVLDQSRPNGDYNYTATIDTSHYTGTTAEWIDEATYEDPLNNDWPLEKYRADNSITWTNCHAHGINTGWKDLAYRDYDRALMRDILDQYYLAYPQGPYNTNSFIDYWQAAK